MLLPAIELCMIDTAGVFFHIKEIGAYCGGIYTKVNGYGVGCMNDVTDKTLYSVPQIAPKAKSAWIGEIDGIVITIREHIIADDAAVGADHAVRIDESPHLRIVIAGLQVIPARFRVVIVRTVTERVDVPNRRSCTAGHRHEVAPRIVGVVHDLAAVRVVDFNDVALQVFAVEVFVSVVLEPDHAARRVVVVIRPPRRAV